MERKQKGKHKPTIYGNAANIESYQNTEYIMGFFDFYFKPF